MGLAKRTLVELFRETVARFPDRVAVTAEDGDLTYRELGRRVDVFARRLRTAGVTPGSLVALLAPRGGRLLVGLLGILEAGAAYVPIDPGYPPERIAWTVQDSGARVVVAAEQLAGAAAATNAAVVLLDHGADEADTAGATSPQPSVSPPHPTVPEDALAYVIYTSGSTGVPKGVQVEHRNVVRLFDATRAWSGFDENDVWTLFHSTAFDFSVWEIWGALLFGGRLVVVPLETARSPESFHALLRTERVTVLNQTPSAFARLAAVDARSAERADSLRLVVFGGERLEPAGLRDWIARHGDERPRLVNMYGITEATVHASYRPITAADLDSSGASPIGEALPDLTFHLLGEDGQPVTDGEPGELCIAGSGLARGYLGRPELNRERFVERTDPAGRRQRHYRTGDLVVALPKGGYGYLGRTDDQMKIRGYRVEPGEIESVLVRHADVSAAVAVARDYGGGDVRVVAYVASTAPDDKLAPALGEHAAATLPPHMQPSAYVVLPELPLTPNGKVDRAALPTAAAGTAAAPVPVGAGDESALSGPERRIARIWQSVLDVPRVDPDVDFFDLGGTSLSLLRMFDQVNAAFGTDLDITVLIEGATVQALARKIDSAPPAAPRTA